VAASVFVAVSDSTVVVAATVFGASSLVVVVKVELLAAGDEGTSSGTVGTLLITDDEGVVGALLVTDDEGVVGTLLVTVDKGVVGGTDVPHLALSRRGHDKIAGEQDNGNDSVPQAVPKALRGTSKFASPLQHCDPVGNPPTGGHVQSTHVGQMHDTGVRVRMHLSPTGLEFGQQN
jgi:hypothetical protein